MRRAIELLMLSSVARTKRFNAFSLSSCPGSPPKVTMSSASTVSFDRVAGDSMGGEGTTLVPKGGGYKNVVVWLHGLGDTADGWSGSMSALGVADTKFILPTAGTRPIALNGGFQMPGWTDITGLSEDAVEDSEGFKASADRVRAILDLEHSKGKEFSRMVVGGFSQGGAVALHTCLRSNEQLAGCVACSSWVPLHKEYPGAMSSCAKDIPVAQFHGTRDDIVQFTWGQHSYHLMKDALGMTTTFQAIPGMGHSACEEELEKIAEFLRKVLPE